MTLPRHKMPYFYKYTTADTAKLVIETLCFRWSAPSKFNDPFDHRARLTFDVQPNLFAQLLTQSAERVVFSDDEPEGVPETNLGSLLRGCRAQRQTLSRREFNETIFEGALDSAEGLEPHLDRFNVFLHEFLERSRVFCVFGNL